MSEVKPSFHDVQRRSIVVRQITKDGVPVLAIEEVYDDGSSRRLMLLNKYDAKQLSAACDRYLQETFAATFAGVNTDLSPEDMAKLFGDD
ncbi:hypothetical protein CDES_04240 [Corynebacterium deserti GIMN1.010]|uniref:Uncharacterized protein n=1 Tax=Corynebacterium deserti GIMN1.010 TaxID=931089 RepID=A0A0M3Q9A1_9CORY|nr:hypothetical protein [Corynebacterium deserti]ALC05293.1 hypothetical protein CDES_04240 [Corynebacterium deserti GIMN1.010]